MTNVIIEIILLLMGWWSLHLTECKLDPFQDTEYCAIHHVCVNSKPSSAGPSVSQLKF